MFDCKVAVSRILLLHEALGKLDQIKKEVWNVFPCSEGKSSIRKNLYNLTIHAITSVYTVTLQYKAMNRWAISCSGLIMDDYCYPEQESINIYHLSEID